jgi:multisubunit Na+/H+ antiporter MnhC subunit
MNADLSQLFWLTTVASFLLILCGFYCLLVGHNMIRLVIAVELMGKGATLFFAAVGKATGLTSHVQSFMITTIVVEAVVIAIAAGIAVSSFKNHKSVDVRSLRKLKG